MINKNSKEVVIVFISDEKYSMPTGVAITSLKTNGSNQDDEIYKVYVISLGISEKSKKRIESLSTDTFQVIFIDYELNEMQKKVRTNNNSHVSTTAIIKFELANIFSQYDKVLYLDSDIIVQKSILNFWNTELEGYYVAAVKDGMCIDDEFQRRVNSLGIESNQYFNSGVLLLNLKAIRGNNISSQLLEYRINGNNYYMDQDAFNVIFKGKVKYASPYYNVFYLWYESEERIRSIAKLYDVDFDLRQGKVFLDATILHFGDYPKPWNVDRGQLSGLFYSYYMLSPFNDRKDLKLKIASVWSLPIKKKVFINRVYSMIYTVLKISGILWIIKKIKGKSKHNVN